VTTEDTSIHLTLMMMTEMDIETSVYYVQLTRLIAREDYIKFTRRESTKTYNSGLCLMACFGISYVRCLSAAAREFISSSDSNESLEAFTVTKSYKISGDQLHLSGAEFRHFRDHEYRSVEASPSRSLTVL